MLLILIGLGYEVTISQSVGLTVAGAVATTVGFFPAGLGLREGVVALISPIVGLPAIVGLAATIMDRMFRMALLGVAAGTVFLFERSKPEALESTESQ